MQRLHTPRLYTLSRLWQHRRLCLAWPCSLCRTLRPHNGKKAIACNGGPKKTERCALFAMKSLTTDFIAALAVVLMPTAGV